MGSFTNSAAQPAARLLPCCIGLHSLPSSQVVWGADNKSIVDSNGARQYVAAVYFVTLTITTVCGPKPQTGASRQPMCLLGTVKTCLID